MEFIAAVIAGGTTGVAASAGLLYAVGDNMRQRVKEEVKHYTNSAATAVAKKTEIVKENLTEGKAVSYVETDQGRIEKRDRSTEVVKFREQIKKYEALGYQQDNNPNRKDNPGDGIF